MNLTIPLTRVMGKPGSEEFESTSKERLIEVARLEWDNAEKFFKLLKLEEAKTHYFKTKCDELSDNLTDLEEQLNSCLAEIAEIEKEDEEQLTNMANFYEKSSRI
jgi:chromosome segregation ATPase